MRECPASFISAEAAALVTDLDRAKTIHDAYGAPIFTEPLMEWPGKMAEMLELLEHERIAEHNARVRAEIKEMEPKR